MGVSFVHGPLVIRGKSALFTNWGLADYMTMVSLFALLDAFTTNDQRTRIAEIIFGFSEIRARDIEARIIRIFLFYFIRESGRPRLATIFLWSVISGFAYTIVGLTFSIAIASIFIDPNVPFATGPEVLWNSLKEASWKGWFIYTGFFLICAAASYPIDLWNFWTTSKIYKSRRLPSLALLALDIIVSSALPLLLIFLTYFWAISLGSEVPDEIENAINYNFLGSGFWSALQRGFGLVAFVVLVATGMASISMLFVTRFAVLVSGSAVRAFFVLTRVNKQLTKISGVFSAPSTFLGCLTAFFAFLFSIV